MTRETKAGLIVSISFLCLVGLVLGIKMKQRNAIADELSETDAALQALAEGIDEPKAVNADGSPIKEVTLNISSGNPGLTSGLTPVNGGDITLTSVNPSLNNATTPAVANTNSQTNATTTTTTNPATSTTTSPTNAATPTTTGATNAASPTTTGATNAASPTTTGATNAASPTTTGATNSATPAMQGANSAATVASPPSASTLNTIQIDPNTNASSSAGSAAGNTSASNVAPAQTSTTTTQTGVAGAATGASTTSTLTNPASTTTTPTPTAAPAPAAANSSTTIGNAATGINSGASPNTANSTTATVTPEATANTNTMPSPVPVPTSTATTAPNPTSNPQTGADAATALSGLIGSQNNSNPAANAPAGAIPSANGGSSNSTPTAIGNTPTSATGSQNQSSVSPANAASSAPANSLSTGATPSPNVNLGVAMPPPPPAAVPATSDSTVSPTSPGANLLRPVIPPAASSSTNARNNGLSGGMAPPGPLSTFPAGDDAPDSSLRNAAPLSNRANAAVPVGSVGILANNDPQRILQPVGAPANVGSPPIVVPAPPGAPTNSALSYVESYDEVAYRCKPADTFESISKNFYNSEDYARALLLFNRNHPRAAESILQDPPAVQLGQAIYVPPLRILVKQYSNVIPQHLLATLVQPTPNAASPTAPSAAAAPSTYAPMPISAPSTNPPTALASNALAPVAAGPKPAAGAWASTANDKQYRVRSNGEKYLDIARRTLGTPDRWWDIYRLNMRFGPEYPVPAGSILKMPNDARISPEDAP